MRWFSLSFLGLATFCPPRRRNLRPTRQILIVEDDDDIRTAIAGVLAMEGFAVCEASNGLEALAQLRSLDRCDLILLDIAMPYKDGVQFRLEQEEDRRFGNVPVIVMTADAHPDARKYQVGAKAALRKPFEVAELLRIIDTTLAKAG